MAPQVVFKKGEAFLVQRLDYDTVQDLLVELQDVAEKYEEHEIARQNDEYGDAERLWRE